MSGEERVRPIFKWPGGKFKLLDPIIEELPSARRLVEPFAGSGVVFLNTDYESYLLADVNRDVIDFYRLVAEEGDAFVAACRELFENGNHAGTYYERRERFNALPPGGERARLFLYLNRHGYNGLVRYNAGGGFNVPFGRYARPYFPEAEMKAFHAKASGGRVEFVAADFRETFARIEPGDAVYCDPPYYPLTATANFTSYAAGAFGVVEQEELAGLVGKAARSGARVVVSNHDVPAVRVLYADACRVREVRVRRSISCRVAKREMVGEVLAIFG